ncbi:MAG TPA: recombination mediator RecR [Chlamydiales bacterium]|nr:recombination mediator RecR [Chlamydiales bacterium]
MLNKKIPLSLQILINHLKKLPGVGSKTAERYAFQMLKWEKQELQKTSEIIASIQEKVRLCPNCGCFYEEKCNFCDPDTRSLKTLCIISSPKDAYMIEETQSYNGLFHVIENLLSPIDGFTEKGLRIELLKKTLSKNPIEEVIIALDSSLEGDATSLYIKESLADFKVQISRIAFGLPVGSSLDFVSGGTLQKAFAGRQIIY